MTALNKHIGKRLIYITLTALLVTSCQSRDSETTTLDINTDDLIVENSSISQQAIRENKPSSSPTVKPQPLAAPTPPVAPAVKIKSTKRQKTNATKVVKAKLSKKEKTTANKNPSTAKVVPIKSAKLPKDAPDKTVKTVSFLADRPKKNEENEIKAIFSQNIQGLNAENLELAMGVIDKNNPSYEQVKQLTQTLFKSFDLKYEINQLEVMEITGNQAKVKVNQTTRKVRGLAFRDHKLVTVSTVKKYNGQWKIANTKTESMIYLN